MFQRNRNGGSSSLETPTILSSGGSHGSTLYVLDRNIVMGPCPMLFNLIRKNKWKKVRRHLNSKKADILCRECDPNGFNVLGFAISFNAPIDILNLIKAIDPSQLDAVTNYLTNPLHLACMYCNSLETVQYVMNNSRSLVSGLDKDGRTPLHHAVECLCTNDDIDATEGFQVVKALTEADPSLITLSDKHKNTPIDVLHLAWADTHPRCVVRHNRICNLHTFLREVSIQEYRRKKIIWESQCAGDETEGDEETNSTQSSGCRKDPLQCPDSKISSKVTAISSYEASKVDGIDEEESKHETENNVKSVKKIKSVFLLSRKNKRPQDK